MAKLQVVDFSSSNIWNFPDWKLFTKSRLHAWWTISKQLAKYESGVDAEISRATTGEDLYNECMKSSSILHLMAHGDKDGTISSSSYPSSNTSVHLKELVHYLKETNSRIRLDAFITDVCLTFFPAWKTAISKSVFPGEEVVFIGTSREVEYKDTSLYFGHFYEEPLKWEYPRIRKNRRQLVLECHDLAARKWEADMSRKQGSKQTCPFKAVIITGKE